MSLPVISPNDARRLMDQGALLVDIRGEGEYAREHIGEARHIPMEQLLSGAGIEGAPAVIFHCRSGNRTRLNAGSLAACTDCQAYVLEGGLNAWKKAGLPVIADAKQPLELQRQVQIAAGAMILLGTLLGAGVAPGFYIIPGFIGCGLIFAGISGFCGLARVLMKMPWNRRAIRA
ncbi:rhodanese family protein [Kerstersia similis]|uniref:rhodanese family protein n=1 Tax=Kerstersia similis TaxID=206505 RepID=UPI0039F01FAF